MKASIFIGTSLDGFIARSNGDLDFLPPGGGEPHGYDEFMATVDALVIGRKTFETVLAFDAWPYAQKPVFVLSSRPLAAAPAGAVVEHLSGAPGRSVLQLAARGLQHIYVDGGAYDSTVSSGGAHSTAHHHARAGVDRIWDSTLRRAAARCRAHARGDASVRERPCAERVPWWLPNRRLQPTALARS